MVSSSWLSVGLAVGLAGMLAQAALGENIVFPKDSGVVDLTQAPYSIKGDGATDCTDAIQRALNENAGKDTTFYLPNGTYVVSDTLKWAGRATRNVLQGQSTQGAVIRLKDRCPGYTNPAEPKTVINTGYSPPQRFRNAIRNVTIDTGKGNHGAIGLQFNASNQGQMNTVTIRSGDGSGVIGLDMGYTGDVGPLMVKGLTVEGFDVGIHTAHPTAAQTMEHITVKNQRVCGWVNDGQAVAIRDFRSVNKVPAFWNKRGSSMVTLLDAQCTGVEGAADAPAMINEGGLYARNVKTSGYKLAIDASQGTGRSVPSAEAAEYTSHPAISLFPSPASSLNLPIEETPEIPWDDPKDWVSVTKFPPKEVTVAAEAGQGGKPAKADRKVMDWTDSIQQAIDSGATTVYFPRDPGAKEPYQILGTIHVRGKVRRIIGMETPLGPQSKAVFQLDDGEAPAVVIERFDLLYTPTIFRTASKRSLVLEALHGYLDVGSGGRVFTNDVICCLRMAAGARMWMRQWNTEYTDQERHALLWGKSLDANSHPGNLNDGGQLWALGIKTEGDGTLLTTINGGKSEVMGGLIYANKNYNPQKRAFVVRDSSLSLSVGEWVIRQQPFNMVEETRSGVTKLLTPGVAPGRGGGGLYVLFTGYTGQAPPAPPVEQSQESPAGSGHGLLGEYFTGEFEQRKETRTEAVDCEWQKQPSLAGAKTCSARWTGRIEPRRTGMHTFAMDFPICRLVVNGQLVIDAWRNGARYRIGRLLLQAGKKYDIKLECRSGPAGGGPVRLEWHPPGQKTEVVPASQLYPPAQPAGEVRLTASAGSMSENGGKVTLTVTRTGDTSKALTVRLAPRVDMMMSMVMRYAARGDAIEGEDYQPLPQSIVIPAGQASVTVDLVAIDDKFPEPTKTVELELAADPDYNVAGPPVTVTILDDDMPNPGTGTGLTGEYFAGKDFTDRKATRVDGKIDFEWDKKAPLAGLDPQNGYAIRWTGQVEPRFSEVYRIQTPMTKYGALTLWLDGKKIIEVSNPGTARGGKLGADSGGLTAARVKLEAGRRHDLKIEFVDLNFYGSNVHLLWSSDSQFLEPIPKSQLYPAAADK